MATNELIIYGKSAGCPPCAATGRGITAHALERLTDTLTTYHVDQDDTLAEEARGWVDKLDLRRESPLALVFRNGGLVDYWTGYRPDKLKALAGQLKAEKVPAAEFTEAHA